MRATLCENERLCVVAVTEANTSVVTTTDVPSTTTPASKYQLSVNSAYLDKKSAGPISTPD